MQGASSGATRRRGEDGFGLIESVVSVALVSTVVLALAAGLLTSVRSSTSARETQELDAALSAYAEAFKDPSVYTALSSMAPTGLCDSANYESAVTPPVGTDAFVDAVEHWGGSAWDGACPGSDVHRLTVRVEMDGSNASGTAEVVMRKP